jgi:D-glycero-D-manno-heptose 1,7-bisphosphate phosphatase
MDTLNAIHDKMMKATAQVGGRIDAVFFCPHTSNDNCSCRKPKPGLFKEIAARYNVDLAGVPAIGDSLRDLQAALAVAAQPVLVLTGKGKNTVEDPALPPGTPVFPDLATAVAKLVAA